MHVILLCILAGLTSVLLPKASSAHWLYPLCLSQASSVLLQAIHALSPSFSCIFPILLESARSQEGFLMTDIEENISFSMVACLRLGICWHGGLLPPRL